MTASSIIIALESALVEEFGMLYHATTLQAFWKIYEDDLFELSYGRGDVEQSVVPKPFFASFSRVPANRYRRNSDVTLVIDADRLKQKHKTQPVDYWRFGPDGSESEERLTSSRPEIKGFRKYIRAVHILYREGVNQEAYRDLKYFTDPPIYVYTDREAYFLLDTRKATLSKDFVVPETAPTPRYNSRNGERELIRMDELLNFLEGGGKNKAKPWHERLWYYPRDFITQLGSEVHNLRSHKGIAVRQIWLRWEKLLKAYGTTSISGFAQAFLNKHGQAPR